ncbi:MAG TPA: hypothetical protein VN177_00755, partial [Myxococcales bacterium]|nr:hypothetical protein [Myxococcales bacterium]
MGTAVPTQGESLPILSGREQGQHTSCALVLRIAPKHSLEQLARPRRVPAVDGKAGQVDIHPQQP